MSRLTFNGIEGTVVEQSPHGSFVVVKLSRRVTICGTFTNQFCWEETPDSDSGFESFITYVGLKSTVLGFQDELRQFYAWIANHGGYFNYRSEKLRKAERVRSFKFESKIRGLDPETISSLLGYNFINI
jgi:hypothetical protein